MRCRHAVAAVTAVLVVAATPELSRAGGFLNSTQSASAAAVANAGVTALAEYAATVFYNPAGLTRLDRPQLLFASGISFAGQSFDNGSASDPAGVPLSGGRRTNPQPFVQPALFAAYPVVDRLHLGLGVFVPFGQSTKYSDDWIGRYQVQQVALKTIDIRPAAAYRVRDWLSVGAGIDIIYAHFQRTNAIDFGGLCVAQLGGGACGALGLTPTGADGRLFASVEDWTVGYDVGILLEPSSELRLGINYRSGVHNNFSGPAQFTVPAAATPLTAGGAFQNTTVKAALPFPAVVSAGAAYQFTAQFTALVDLS